MAVPFLLAFIYLAYINAIYYAMPYINDALMEWECSLTSHARYFFPLS